MSDDVSHLLTAFADEVLEWNLESSWGSGASKTFASIIERYTYEIQTLTTCDDGCSVPVSSLLKLLLLIDPAPVVVTENEVMVFKNPKAADVLTQISAEVRSLIASAQKVQQGIPAAKVVEYANKTKSVVWRDRDLYGIPHGTILYAQKGIRE